jgi:hypothetical protein
MTHKRFCATQAAFSHLLASSIRLYARPWTDPRNGTKSLAEDQPRRSVKIEEIQGKHPDLDVFFDGDEFAICSVPRRG